MAILTDQKCNFQIHQNVIDDKGRLIALDIDIEGERLTLLNLYASNEDELSTLELALTKIQEFDNNNVIWGGI